MKKVSILIYILWIIAVLIQQIYWITLGNYNLGSALWGLIAICLPLILNKSINE